MFLDVGGPVIVFGEEVDISMMSLLLIISFLGFIISLTFFMLEFYKKKYSKANKTKLIVSGICALLCIGMGIYFFVKTIASRSGGVVDPVNTNWEQE